MAWHSVWKIMRGDAFVGISPRFLYVFQITFAMNFPMVSAACSCIWSVTWL